MKHVISFRRPEHPNTVTRLSVPPDQSAAAYVRRLGELGYKIVDVVPPLEEPNPAQTPKRQGHGEAETLL